MISTFALTAVLLAAPPVVDVAAPPAAAPVATPGADSGLVVVPARVDLGAIEIGTSVRGSVWLVNSAQEPVTVEKASAGCGCTKVEFEPVTLAPGAAQRVWFDIKASKKVKTKDVKIAFQPAWGDRVTLTTTLATVEPAGAAPTTLAKANAAETDVVLVPVANDLGTVTSGAAVDTSAWIINGGDTVAHVSAFKAGCGCTTAVGFAPVDLAPGTAQRVRLRVEPTVHAGGKPDKRVALRAVVDGGAAPARATLTMQVREQVAARPVQ